MKIFDCITFNDENSILEIRLNELNKYVDYFVIVEFGENHQGNKKGQKIDKVLLEKFKNKVRYIYVDSFKNNLSSWERENYQRNLVKEGLYDADEDDIIIISDLDEIPDLSQIDLQNIDEKIYAFQQINTMYKFNLVRDFDWIGSKLCKFKKLKSPQWIRSLKVRKKYSYFRIDKFFSSNYTHNFEVIEKGGWHFGWIRDINQIINKLESFAHTEFNNNKFKNYQFINECMEKNLNFLDTTENLTKIKMSLLPNYLLNNKDKFKSYLK